MLEAQPLDRIIELDIDTQIIGIQLQLIALEQASLFVHIHDQGRNLSIDLEAPMLVAGRVGLKVDPHPVFSWSMLTWRSSLPWMTNSRWR